VRVVDRAGAVLDQLPYPLPVRGCRFAGDVTLVVDGADGESSGGLYDSDITTSTISVGARLSRATLVRVNVEAGAQVVASVVTGCGLRGGGAAAECSPPPPEAFGCGLSISVGCSTGGRAVPLSDVLDFDAYTVLALPGMHADVAQWRAYTTAAARTVSTRTAALRAAAAAGAGEGLPRRWRVAYPCSAIGSGAIIAACPDVTATATVGCVTLQGATVSDALLQGTRAAPTVVAGAAVVLHAVVHPGCRIDSGAAVAHSVLFPLSGARKHGVITESVVASGTVVSEAEVSHCLLGPFVGLHHHSLLIAALWPGGRGNIAYGANVGSNHTGKLPDQEIFPGEGVFYGLGVSIKFPFSMAEAPYSLVASGVVALPQRITLPFSLINGAGAGATALPGISPAINELCPGWMLSDNAYAVYRNEAKFSERARALDVAVTTAAGDSSGKPHTRDGAGFAFDIMQRRDLLALVVAARDALRAAKRPTWALGGKKVEPAGGCAAAGGTGAAAAAAAPAPLPSTAVYTDVHVPAMGKNYMTEAARQRGIAAYSRYIHLFLLRALFVAVVGSDPWQPAGGGGGGGGPLTATDVAAAVAEGLLPPAVAAGVTPSASPAYTAASAPALFTAVVARYAVEVGREAAAVGTSKSRDGERGRKILPDYDAVHAAVEDDSVVRHLRRVAAATRAAATEWAARAHLPAADVAAALT